MDIEQLTLHPNPTTGTTTLTLLSIKAVAQVSIADIADRVLWSDNTSESNTVLLPVADFTAGNYLVIVV